MKHNPKIIIATTVGALAIAATTLAATPAASVTHPRVAAPVAIYDGATLDSVVVHDSPQASLAAYRTSQRAVQASRARTLARQHQIARQRAAAAAVALQRHQAYLAWLAAAKAAAHRAWLKAHPVVYKAPVYKAPARQVSSSSTAHSVAGLSRDWQRVVQCESSGILHESSSSGEYWGLFQIGRGWYAGAGLDPRTATFDQQWALAQKIFAIQGWGAWTCARIVGII